MRSPSHRPSSEARIFAVEPGRGSPRELDPSRTRHWTRLIRAGRPTHGRLHFAPPLGGVGRNSGFTSRTGKQTRPCCPAPGGCGRRGGHPITLVSRPWTGTSGWCATICARRIRASWQTRRAAGRTAQRPLDLLSRGHAPGDHARERPLRAGETIMPVPFPVTGNTLSANWEHNFHVGFGPGDQPILLKDFDVSEIYGLRLGWRWF